MNNYIEVDYIQILEDTDLISIDFIKINNTPTCKHYEVQYRYNTELLN